MTKAQALNIRLKFLRSSLASLSGLLWEKVLVNVWQDTTLSDGNVSEKLVQFLVVSDGELKMTWDDTRLLVVTSGVSSQFENFGSEVFEDGSEVNWGTSTNTLGIVTLPQESVNTTDWESETGLGRSALRSLSIARSSLAT